jgi:hypothetical protein
MNEIQARSGRVVLPLIVLSVVLAGCVTKEQVPAPGGSTVRENSYALLFDLMGDEKNVSKLLIIKRERAELRELIRKISRRADAAHEQIEKFGKTNPRINLEDLGLPLAEVETRKSISKAKASELLTDKGGEFELRLLLTQSEALTYGTHLAIVAARHEPDPVRAQFLNELSADLSGLHDEVIALMLASYSWPGAK